MAIHLEVVDLGVWRVTRDGMKPIKNPDKPTKNEEKEIHLNARTKNCLFESFSEDVFNQVFTLNTAHEIWLKLQELHDGTSNVREQKYCLARQTFDSFEMNDDELVHDIYSRLNLIVNELNSIGLTKLGDANIVRKIISALPQKKYASIITILHNMEDLSTMTPAIVIGNIVAFEMSCKMGQEEGSSSSKDKALACSEKKKMKSKQVETSSSSSSSSEDDKEDDDESSDDDQSSSSTFDLDEESIKLINKVEKMIQRLNVKGVPIQIQDCSFTNQRREQRKRGCYGCGELGHFVEVCPNKTTPKTKRKACKDKALTSIRSWDDSSSEEEDHHKRRGHKHSSSNSSRVCLMA
jgi:hypothetical protein